jgi:hypothetical protein
MAPSSYFFRETPHLFNLLSIIITFLLCGTRHLTTLSIEYITIHKTIYNLFNLMIEDSMEISNSMITTLMTIAFYNDSYTYVTQSFMINEVSAFFKNIHPIITDVSGYSFEKLCLIIHWLLKIIILYPYFNIAKNYL